LPKGITKGKISGGHVVTVKDPNHPSGRRHYALYVPVSYNPSAPTPLVLDFHGFYDDARSEAKEDGVTLAAHQEGFIVAYPNGLGDKPGDPNDWWNQWNGGGTNGTGGGKYGNQTCTSDHSKYPCYQSCITAGVCQKGKRKDCACSGCSDDKGFIVNLLEKLKADFCLDESRLHGTGISNGAIFLYYLAASHEVGSQLASIVPVEGSFVLGFLDTPKLPMPLMDIHGTKDNCVPANVSNSWGKYKRLGCPLKAAGKYGCAVGDDGWFYHPMPEILSSWSVANKCPPGSVGKPIQTPYDGQTGWSCMAPHGDQCEASTQFCTHNLGHTWPFDEDKHRVRTKEFGEMLWTFMKEKRRIVDQNAGHMSVVV